MSYEATRKLLAELVGIHHTGRRVDELHRHAARMIEQHHRERAEVFRQYLPSAGMRVDDLDKEYLDSCHEMRMAKTYT